MQVTADQTNPCTVVLDITIEEPQVSRAFDSSYREFGRYVNVPGFRPGKAPRVLVERYVDTARVRQHTLEKIIRDSYPAAVSEQDIKPYRDPEIEPTDLEDRKPFSYRAVVPLEPKVEIGPYTGLTVDKPVFKITDADVEERITSLRTDKARLERVTDRGIQNGDVVIAEHEIRLEGADEPEPARRQLVYIGNNIPGYDEHVLGLKAGDQATFELTYPDDFEEESRRGKKATYQVNVISISAKQLPALTDDFAQDVASVDTVEALRELIKSRLQAEADRVSNEIAEQRIIEKILEGSTVNFPEVLVHDELRDKLRSLGQDLQKNRMTYEEFLQRTNQTAEQHQAQLAAQSAEQIRALLALREIAIAEGLQADDAAIDAEFDRMATEGRVPEETIEEFRGDNRRRLQIANALIQQKLHEFLFANNTLNEVAQSAGPTEDEVGTAAQLIADESEEASETEE
ncbi:MAG TPA: trigger factor [Chthonomonadaceae bacterium]|nr:trigger factor [Chthonomonadaceae bacterium]